MKQAKPRLRNKTNRDEMRQKLADSTEPRTTLSFYKYQQLAEPKAFRDDFYQKMAVLGVFGRVYVSAEGINGQISVPTEKLDIFRETLYGYDFLKNCRLNFAAEDDGKSFFLLNVKIREKIVADGLADPDFDSSKTGQHLTAAAFNELAERPETIIVDMRNRYAQTIAR